MSKPTITFGIDTKEISHFTSIELVQTINNHHQFSISVPHSVIEKPRAYTIESAQAWLGKVVHIALDDKNNFLGIITNIQFAQEDDHVGNQIIITGFSKTILLESGEKLFSWNESVLKDIVKEVIQNGAGSQLQNEVEPEYTSKMNYQCQYLETDFQFLQRLAKQYNEWFYYDGEKLHFGKPKELGESITLVYNKDLSKLNIAIQAVPNKFSGFTYNEETDKKHLAQSKDSVAGLPKLGNEAFASSKEVFTTPAFSYGMISTGDDMVLETYLKKKQEAAASNTNYVTAHSKNPKLRIGSLITIQASIHESVKFVTQDVGQYIITEITHHATHLGEYENNFRAIPAKVLRLPEPDVAFPMAQIQQAKVMNNTDPKNKGRIKVQMLWQKGQQQTDWIRVMTPDAGGPSNRGFVFIPEVGDYVMLGFRYNDPNRPFVIGSVFNGTTGAGGGSGNNSKTIKTKSGSTIAFQEDKKSITITDGAGNSVALDGAGNISVSSSASISLSTGESSITLKSDGTIDISGKDVSVNGSATINNTSPSVTITGNDEVVVTSKTKVDINSPNEVSVTGTAKATLSSSATTAVEGTIIKLN